MHAIRRIAVAAAVVSAALGSSGTALAAPAGYAQPVVESVSSTVIASSANGGFALVQARYRCWGGDANTHLFIAVKQGPDVSPENPSSSPSMTAFYSTNWGSDGPSLRLHCDGASHSQVFKVRNDPYWGKADQALPLTNGPAFVQVCVFDSKATEDLSSGFAAAYEMKTVRVLH